MIHQPDSPTVGRKSVSCQQITVTTNTTLTQEIPRFHTINPPQNLVLEGTFLIKLNAGCQFRTNDKTFQNTID